MTMCIGQEVFLLAGQKNVPRQIIRAWFMEMGADGPLYTSAFWGKGFPMGEDPGKEMLAAAGEWPLFGDDVEVASARKMGLWQLGGPQRHFSGEVVGWHVGYRPKESWDGIEHTRQLVMHIGVRVWMDDGTPRIVHARAGRPGEDTFQEVKDSGLKTSGKMKMAYGILQDDFQLGSEFFGLTDGKSCFWTPDLETTAKAELAQTPVAASPASPAGLSDLVKFVKEGAYFKPGDTSHLR